MFTYLGSKLTTIRQRIEAILAMTSQGFVLINERELITDCNKALADLAGNDNDPIRFKR